MARTKQLTGEYVAAVDAETQATIENNDALELKRKYEELASGIAGEFTDAFKSIIDGTKSVEEALPTCSQALVKGSWIWQ